MFAEYHLFLFCDVLANQSASDRCAVGSILEDLPVDSEDLTCPVSMLVDGRQVVMLDVATYSHMLEELVMLKKQLNLLTKVIQVGLSSLCLLLYVCGSNPASIRVGYFHILLKLPGSECV